jgi:alpha-N-arabinofuranosidase
LQNATVHLDTHFNAGQIDPRIFSGFLEHLGRAIYGGVFDPGNPLSDKAGLRKDVIEDMRELRMPFVRYPGGNFVSNYDWRDGIGPVERRKPFPDFAWKSVEPNTFGTDEFIKWCRAVGTEPMLAVNLGTLGPAEAAGLVEYCNMTTPTRWAEQRGENGSKQPHNVKMWCLGNEMDGPWQAGHSPAESYALKAMQAARLMKGMDPSIELVAAGSSGRALPTYLEWDRAVLERCWDDIDFISAHRYSRNPRGNTPWFLAEGLEIDRILDDYAGVISYVKGVKKSDHDVYLSFDEWNVWSKDRGGNGGWKVGPALIEEVYDLQDALVCAQYLNAFIRRADLVKVACLAQIVNVIAAVLTSEKGSLRQTIFYPSAMYAAVAKGLSLTPVVEAPRYDALDREGVPLIDVSASFDEATGEAAVFVVNRSMTEDVKVTVQFADRVVKSAGKAQVLTGDGPRSANTWSAPDTITPQPAKATANGQSLEITVPQLGLAVVSGVKTTAR